MRRQGLLRRRVRHGHDVECAQFGDGRLTHPQRRQHRLDAAGVRRRRQRGGSKGMRPQWQSRSRPAGTIDHDQLAAARPGLVA